MRMCRVSVTTITWSMLSIKYLHLCHTRIFACLNLDRTDRPSRSTITLRSVYRLQLLPLFDRFCCYACDVCFSVPTRGGFYTPKFSLERSHVTGNAEITLGSDWMTRYSATSVTVRSSSRP